MDASEEGKATSGGAPEGGKGAPPSEEARSGLAAKPDDVPALAGAPLVAPPAPDAATAPALAGGAESG
eukprot:6348463-Alexandrium_andersonii.AAC.1